MDDFITADIKQTIYKCFRTYGLEGTLEKIETLYESMPTLRERFLTEYAEIINKKYLKENN